MCMMSAKMPDPPRPVPMEVPSSDAARRTGEVEQELRRRRAGVRNDIVTTPLGLPTAA